MDPVTAFLVVGGVGVVFLLIALVVGDLLNLGHVDADGPFSLPAICSLIGGAGFIGAIPAALLPESMGASRVLISAVIGLAGALPIAWGAVKLSRGLNNMNTDKTLTDSDALGALGVVVTSIPANGLGEVLLTLGGQHLKYNARSHTPLASGTPVYVVDIPTPTSVEVISTAD